MYVPSSHSGRRSPLEIKMTPMIDVVFLLLVFFVWTSNFQKIEQLLPSSVSSALGNQPMDIDQPPPPQADFSDVVIRIRWIGTAPSWTVNDAPVNSLIDLQGHLQVIAGIKTDAPVILHPDRDVPLGHVIDVYDLARVAGFEKVNFTANEAG